MTLDLDVDSSYIVNIIYLEVLSPNKTRPHLALLDTSDLSDRGLERGWRGGVQGRELKAVVGQKF